MIQSNTAAPVAANGAKFAGTIIQAEPIKRLTKVYRGDANSDPKPYDNVKLVRAHPFEADTFEAFIDHISDLPPNACLIRGAVRAEALPDVTEGLPILRREYDRPGEPAAFEPVARRWITLDADDTTAPFDPKDVRGSVERWRATLPAEIRTARSAFFLSANSHRSATVRGKLIVELVEALDNRSAEIWAKLHGFDPSVCRTVQPEYLAPPVFEGCIDPLAEWRKPILFEGTPATLQALPATERTVSRRSLEYFADTEPTLTDRVVRFAEQCEAVIMKRWLDGDRVQTNAALHLFSWLVKTGWTKGECAALLEWLDSDEPEDGKVAEHRHILSNANPNLVSGPGGAKAWLGDDFDVIDKAVNWSPQWEARERRAAERAANDDYASEATRPKATVEAPVPILQSREDSGLVLLWEGKDLGYQPVNVQVLHQRIKELGLDVAESEPCVTLLKTPRGTITANGLTFRSIAYDYALRASIHDAPNERVIVGYPLKPIPPVFDQDVDTWLHSIAGDDYDRLAEWIASCAQKNIPRLAAALVLIGPKDIGKSVLACAASSLWGQTKPPKAEALIERFNGDLARCPIVFDDECERFSKGDISTRGFREIIQSRERVIERKGQEKFVLTGTLRVIIACNEVSDLQFVDFTGPDAVNAVADRLCVFDSKPRADECRRAIDKLKPNPDSPDVDLPRFVRHFAWIGGNVKLSNARFTASGGNTKDAILQGHVKSHAPVFESLEAWLADPAGEGDKGPWHAVNGQLGVNVGALVGTLQTGADRRADHRTVRTALEPFYEGKVRTRAVDGTPRLLLVGAEEVADACGLNDDQRKVLDKRLMASKDQIKAPERRADGKINRWKVKAA